MYIIYITTENENEDILVHAVEDHEEAFAKANYFLALYKRGLKEKASKVIGTYDGPAAVSAAVHKVDVGLAFEIHSPY